MEPEKLAKIQLDPDEKAPRGSGNRTPRALLAAAAALALLLLTTAFLYLRRSESEAPPESATAAPSNTSAARQPPGDRDSSRTLAAGGYVEAHRTALVWPGRGGVVAKVHVVRGQRVREGQLLLELDSRGSTAAVDMARAELASAEARYRRLREGARDEEVAAAEAQLAEAEAQLADAEAELERLRSLAGGELVADSELQRTRFRAEAAAARVESLRAQRGLLVTGTHPADLEAQRAEVARRKAALRAAEVDLDLTRLRAPFDGVVVAVELEPGEVVSLFDMGSGIEVADESELWVRVDVPEGRIGGLELGDRAEVVAQAIGPEPLAARVVEIAPKADRQSNTVEVAVAIADPPAVLRPDMSARVQIFPTGGSR